MDDEFVTSRWSDSESSTGSFRMGRITWKRGTTSQDSSAQGQKKEAPRYRCIASALGLRTGTKDTPSPKATHAPDSEPHPPQHTSFRATLTHRQLPDEHQQSRQLAQRAEPQEELVREHRILRGPVPRQPTSGEDPRLANKDTNTLRQELELLFLAPCEKKVLFLLSQTRSASRFRPLLEPQHELLLVNVLDYDNILEAQTLVKELPEDERQLMWSNLHGQLPAHQLYILRLILFTPEIRITTHTRGSGVESPEVVSRPDTTLFFSRIQELAVADPKKIRWNDTPEPSCNTGTLSGAPQLRLRGGGGDPWRSLQTYHTYFCSSRSVRRLEDEERPPTVLWWLAGGNHRQDRKMPTGRVLRTRRIAEKENRQAVGFWGTVRGARRRKSRSAGEAGADDADDESDVVDASIPPGPKTTREISDDSSASFPNGSAEVAGDHAAGSFCP
ncbi:hypothetical protein DOTSEDRAFT_69532 [Dothistroma septosporum NZE10]|uniref:Uncharacterized protein n=1 Tax=Dothistroma septosporum (strain NZE10 / CBS 128990) TaxID=675120 RepID=N1PW74_DOTSN|nr:hypothetical protein DOTSEDRAFT_69532 [Dothistroma septosporum NZE10]